MDLAGIREQVFIGQNLGAAPAAEKPHPPESPTGRESDCPGGNAPYRTGQYSTVVLQREGEL